MSSSYPKVDYHKWQSRFKIQIGQYHRSSYQDEKLSFARAQINEGNQRKVENGWKKLGFNV